MGVDGQLNKEEDAKNYGEIGVYKLFHTSKPNLLYIGSATNQKGRVHCRGFYSRWSNHLWSLKNNKHHSKRLQRIANKYGINGLRFEIILITKTRDEAISEEQKLLDLLSPKLNTLKVANSSKGFIHSVETKIIMSKQRSGMKRVPMSEDTKLKLSISAKKRDLSYLRTKEIRAKISEKTKGRPLIQIDYDKVKVSVKQFDLDGIYIKSFESISSAGKETNIDRSSITHCINGNRISCGGFLWSYSDIQVSIPKKRKIIQYDMNAVCEYSTVEEILRKLKLKSSTAIRNCFVGKQHQAYGYIWKEIHKHPKRQTSQRN